jgi:hypothetical protein
MIGPKVEFDAGDRAPPIMPDTTPIIRIAAGVKPNFSPRGTYTAATMEPEKMMIFSQ